MTMVGALGIFGGSFDPVHYGHLRAATEVRRLLGLAELRLVPARDPPHRGLPTASAAHRQAMLELALAEFPDLALDTRELARAGKSYTITTLEELRSESGTRPLVLVVGADNFVGLTTWHRWRELLDYAHLAVATRPGTRIEDAVTGPLAALWANRQQGDRVQLETTPAGSIFSVPVTPHAISSTAIRTAIGLGKPGVEAIRGLLPPAVLAYIELHQLYAKGPDAR